MLREGGRPWEVQHIWSAIREKADVLHGNTKARGRASKICIVMPVFLQEKSGHRKSCSLVIYDVLITTVWS